MYSFSSSKRIKPILHISLKSNGLHYMGLWGRYFAKLLLNTNCYNTLHSIYHLNQGCPILGASRGAVHQISIWKYIFDYFKIMHIQLTNYFEVIYEYMICVWARWRSKTGTSRIDHAYVATISMKVIIDNYSFLFIFYSLNKLTVLFMVW